MRDGEGYALVTGRIEGAKKAENRHMKIKSRAVDGTNGAAPTRVS